MPAPIMGRPVETPETSEAQRLELLRLINASTTPQRLVHRARIVLNRAMGKGQAATAKECATSWPSVIRWERRFADLGVAGLERDAPGRGRKSSIPEVKKEKIIVQATQPPPNWTRWSQRSMAKQIGVSASTVRRIWVANAIKPHLTRTFKLSRDPNFEAKFWDVIGLYLTDGGRHWLREGRFWRSGAWS